jgi:hypothetical protein
VISNALPRLRSYPGNVYRLHPKIFMADPRFARLRTDPRFRKPKNSHNKIVIDERFKSIFDDDTSEFKGKRRGLVPNTQLPTRVPTNVTHFQLRSTNMADKSPKHTIVTASSDFTASKLETKKN